MASPKHVILPLVKEKEVMWVNGIYKIERVILGEKKEFSGPDRALLIAEANAFLMRFMQSKRTSSN
jgi:hypothetical protein